MADIRDISGQIKLIQSRSVSRDDAGALSFIVQSETSEPTGFSEPVLGYSPDLLFVYQDSGFIRIAAYEDLITVPASRPEEPGGLYRRANCTRTFQDAREAIAWAREVYTAVTGLTSQLRDYAAVFEDVTEEAFLPTDFFTQLQTAVDTYLSVVAELDELSDAIDVAKAKQTILDLVYDYSRLETEDENGDPVTSVNILRTNLPRLRAGLSGISAKVLYAVGADVGGNQSIPDAVTGIREDILPMLAQIETALNFIQTDVDTTESELAAVTTPVALTGDDLLHFNAAVDSADSAQAKLAALLPANTIVAIRTELTTILGSLVNYRNTMLTSNTGVDLMSQIIATGDGAAMDVESAVQKLNTLSTVNNAALMKLKAEVDKEVVVRENEYEAKLKEKTEAWTSVTSIYPDADPDSPLDIFTHRVFTVSNESS
jgi:hypothetical protein